MFTKSPYQNSAIALSSLAAPCGLYVCLRKRHLPLTVNAAALCVPCRPCQWVKGLTGLSVQCPIAENQPICVCSCLSSQCGEEPGQQRGALGAPCLSDARSDSGALWSGTFASVSTVGSEAFLITDQETTQFFAPDFDMSTNYETWI